MRFAGVALNTLSNATPFEGLRIDCAKEVDRIAGLLHRTVVARFRKRGVVIGLSGGVDSSVVGAICTRALGPDRVFGLLMPERESSESSTRLGRLMAESLGIRYEIHDITEILEAAGCYQRRDDSIRRVIPEYTTDFKCKITLPTIFGDASYRIFSVVVESPQGRVISKRLSTEAYLGILSASNLKQRVRKMIEYYHAERQNFSVIGTPNRLEYDQGFFVKFGDSAADIKPIAHLYKTQVYQLAEYLLVPEEIRTRQPTTDTYSMAQSQEEFFFPLPFNQMDVCLYGKNNDLQIEDVASASGLSVDDVRRVYRDIDAKREASRYLQAPPLLVESVAEIPRETETM